VVKTKSCVYLKLFSALIALSFLQTANLQAADKALPLSKSFDLSQSTLFASGEAKTFFTLMNERYGIKAALDKDYMTPFFIIDAKTFRERVVNFAHLAKLERNLKGGSEGLDALIEELAGREVFVDDLYGQILSVLKTKKLFAPQFKDPRRRSRLAGALAPIVALTSGKGVHVQLDIGTYVYNVSYAIGSGGTDYELDKQDRRTGRSYGASITRNSYDPSDRNYLEALGIYVSRASKQELENFYRTLFEILLKMDTRGIQDLNAKGQTVMADFMAIYMAEIIRHLMTGLKRYEWENALTEITMLAAFSAHKNGITFDPRTGHDNENGKKMAPSNELTGKQLMVGFFGVGTDGSGLDGRNKRRRHVLTKQIVEAMRIISKSIFPLIAF